jgi:hypothetical protein
VAIDPQAIGTMAMRFMERLEDKFGEDANVEVLALIAAVDHGDKTSIEYTVQSGEGALVPRYQIRGLLEEVRGNL